MTKRKAYKTTSIVFAILAALAAMALMWTLAPLAKAQEETWKADFYIVSAEPYKTERENVTERGIHFVLGATTEEFYGEPMISMDFVVWPEIYIDEIVAIPGCDDDEADHCLERVGGDPFILGEYLVRSLRDNADHRYDFAEQFIFDGLWQGDNAQVSDYPTSSAYYFYSRAHNEAATLRAYAQGITRLYLTYAAIDNFEDHYHMTYTVGSAAPNCPYAAEAMIYYIYLPKEGNDSVKPQVLDYGPYDELNGCRSSYSLHPLYETTGDPIIDQEAQGLQNKEIARQFARDIEHAINSECLENDYQFSNLDEQESADDLLWLTNWSRKAQGLSKLDTPPGCSLFLPVTISQ